MSAKMSPLLLLQVALPLLVLTSLSGAFDDWPLVRKYCPLTRDVKVLPPHATGSDSFYIYEDHAVYEDALRTAFASVLGPQYSTRSRYIFQQSEFFGEVIIFCELLMHPSRTWNSSEAQLFIVPAFPYLLPDSTAGIAAQLTREPSWQRSRGRDHMVMCTHWACATRLGSLFYHVALPGYVGGLEINAKWLDPRIYRVDM